jgi:PhzF family phenazine biosynthesis protein
MSRRGPDYFLVDAFTNQRFTGNPAAVLRLEHWPDDHWLQNVAMEMNLSETAYLVPTEAGYDLRWFTPKVEVDLCGHATLASAKVLAHVGELDSGSVVAFATRSGTLRAKREGDQYELDFPVKPAQNAEPPPGLLESLRAQPTYVGRNEFDFLLELESEQAVRALCPDFRKLAAVNCRGTIVTAVSSDSQFDFVSRFFAPAAGIEEDPVTGSAHCCLADFWAKRLGRTKMVGFQASARGGIVGVELRADRVMLRGEAVIIARGELLADP